MASGSSALVWIRRVVPAALGAGLLYLTWRIVSENDAPVKVDFLIGRVELLVWEALLGAFVSGAALVGIFTLYQMARGGLVSRRYRKKLSSLESELHQLRNLPLQPESIQPESIQADGHASAELPSALIESGGSSGKGP